MPLVRISLNRNDDPRYAAAIGDGVHRALVETMNVPADDKFQIITADAATQIVYAPQYLGIDHSDAIVIVQITLNTGRTVEQKRALYARIADSLVAEPGVPRADIIISLVEVTKENWSFGDGVAQYALLSGTASAARYSWIKAMTMLPSPTPDATRLIELLRTSPAAKNPGHTGLERERRPA